MPQRWIYWFFATFLILCCGRTPAVPAAEVSFAEARFESSTDATKMLLHVRYFGGLGASFQSLSLYGDGRLVLKRGRKNKVEQEHTDYLNSDEGQVLVRMAVDAGLAEWDGTAFLAKCLEANAGRPVTVPSDAMRAVVLLSLDNYSRGTYTRGPLEQKIDLAGPKFLARHFPDLSEADGVSKLVDELLNRLRFFQDQARD